VEPTEATGATTARFTPVIVKSSNNASMSAADEEEVYECIDDYAHLLGTMQDQTNTDYVTRNCTPLPAIPDPLYISDSLNGSTLKSVCNRKLFSHRIGVMIAGFILAMFVSVVVSLVVYIRLYNIPKSVLTEQNNERNGKQSYS